MANKNGFNCAKSVGTVTEEDAIQEAIRASLEEQEKKLLTKEEKESEESFEDLYDDNEETTISEDKPKKEEKKSKKEAYDNSLDKHALESTEKLLEVFGVSEDKKMTVYKWVKAKNTYAINELLNLFIDEMAGRI